MNAGNTFPSSGQTRGRRCRLIHFAGVWLCSWLLAGAVQGADPDPAKARRLLLTGDYRDAITAAEQALKDDEHEEWTLIRLEALLATGRYPEALTITTNALARDTRSIRLRWAAREVFRRNGRPNEGDKLLRDIRVMVQNRPWAYQDAPSLVVFGRTALLAGADPKDILDKVYATAKKVDADQRDVYLAGGDLALGKHDYALAAKHFEEGLRKLPEDPDLHFGRARAYATGDREVMVESLEAALKQNPRHVPSLLLLADNQIDGEDYDGALERLEEVTKVNPWQPEAHAYRAVIAHLRNQPAAEAAAREAALKFWDTNPEVPHLIGRKLSEKYRFAEGAALQREALRFEREYLPAMAQLASDLLRLGEEGEGWELAQRVHDLDAYDVSAFNLVTLHDTMTKFATLTNEHFVLRMSSHEAEVYGPRALRLLENARRTLSAKYGFTQTQPVIVEIFPQQKDFGVRTFGMPDNPGYLGVCFGHVITANSPAANKGSTVNWEAVLWHEFCHVVTLQLTKNRMPRWLSEGISTYEERQANPAWGEQLTPKYREMILEGELTPVSRLSAAFLMPKSPLHLQFAYYESSLVVEFLIGRFGVDPLKAVLRDLGDGVFINEALEKHTIAMDTLEKDFAAFAKQKAEALAPELEWKKPDLTLLASADEGELAEWAEKNPANYYALTQRTAKLLEEKRWADAKAPLTTLIERYASQTGNDSAYARLARVHRELGETDAERAVLDRFAKVDAEATDAYLRLMELESSATNWPGVLLNAERFLAVNPLVAPPYRFLSEATARAGDKPAAIEASQTLLLLDPPNPSEVHFRLAQLLDGSDQPAARRHLLQSLEDAPRNRAALQLLLKLKSTNAPPRRIRLELQ